MDDPWVRLERIKRHGVRVLEKVSQSDQESRAKGRGSGYALGTGTGGTVRLY